MKYMNREYKAPLSTLHRGVLGDTPAAEVMDHYEDVINKINTLACLAGRLSSETGAASAAYSHLAMDGDGEPLMDPKAPLPRVVEIKGRLSHVLAEMADLGAQVEDLWNNYDRSIRETAGRQPLGPLILNGRKMVVKPQN